MKVLKKSSVVDPCTFMRIHTITIELTDIDYQDVLVTQALYGANVANDMLAVMMRGVMGEYDELKGDVK